MSNYLVLVTVFLYTITGSRCGETPPIYTYDVPSASSQKCDDGSYQCNDGSCIPEIYYCNGMIDCETGEDEQDCKTCPPNFCPCADGLCIQISGRCNAKIDCVGEGEDEKNCTYSNTRRQVLWNFYKPEKQCTFEGFSPFIKLDCRDMELVSMPCVTRNINTLIISKNKLGLFSGLSNLSFIGDYYEFLGTLIMEKNHIKSLPTKMFQHRHNLRELLLGHNQIVHLDGVVFPPNLMILHLQNNKIKNISSKVFENLKQLHDLQLWSNQIEYLDDEIFNNLHSLETLNLTRNSIQTLGPNTFFSVVGLRILDLSHNQIQFIDNRTFHRLKSLTTLCLNFNNITKLEGNLFESQKILVELILSHNQIYIVDNQTFSRLGYLTILDLSHNELTELGLETFQNLKDLHRLKLNDNHIVKIQEDTFRNTTRLNNLFVNRNNITKLFFLPPSIYGGSFTFDISENELEEINISKYLPSKNGDFYDLNLGHNKLKTLRSGMLNGTKVTYLRLNNNQISAIEDSALSGLDKRKYKSIFLNSNNLTKITHRMFEGVTVVSEILSLHNNRITAIEDDAFEFFDALISLDLGSNALSKLTNYMFRGVKEVSNITLQNNRIESIEQYCFNEMKYLKMINLTNNRLTELRSDMFRGSYALQRLDFQINKIKNIERNVFYNLTRLVELNLSDNKLTELRLDTFEGLVHLQELYLQGNKIRNIDRTSFRNLTELQTLDLSGNMIGELTSNMFGDLFNMQTLFLQRNRVKNIEEDAFKNLKTLTTLDLSNNEIASLPSNILSETWNLKTLLLQNNEIKTINEFAFSGLTALSTLNLRNNQIGDVNPNIFKALKRLQKLTVDEFRFCCLKKNIKKCESPRDEFSSCEDLMKNILLRTFVWILGIASIVANLFVVIFRIKYRSANTNQVNSYLIKNLAMSDLFMGIYLLIIATTDIIYRGEYYLHDKYWRESYWCNLAGFLSTFSSELTVFILAILSIDRLYAIRFPIRARQRGIRRTKNLIRIVWILAALISALPLSFFYIPYFKNFYGRSGVCLSLHITNDTPTGWQYSVFVFIILNAILFLIIAVCYFAMYLITIRARRSITSSNRTKDTVMAFRMTLLVMADAACWIPIITLGIRSLMGTNPSPQVYPWIAVFVLPLNAALNPILYTISSIPLVIKVKSPNTRLNGRLGFRWPFYWVAANKTRNT